MPGTLERHAGAAVRSPREAAFVTGLSEKTINQAIDRDEVATVPATREDDHDRMLAFSELVYLRLRETVGRLLSPEGKQMLREQLAEVRGEPASAVSLGALELTVAPEVEAVKERLASIEQVRSFVTTDDDVRAGEPVVRGTRIPVSVLADLARQGASTEELLEDYPSLTPESLEAALTYARLYPRRGRPKRAGWGSEGVVVKRGS